MTAPRYRDQRRELWRDAFDTAQPYDAYLESSDPTHARKWRDFEAQVELQPDCRRIVEGFTRRLNVLVHSGVWCGDCVRQGPILRAIAEANPCIDLRFAERFDGTPLTEELRLNGALKVPVAVFLSEDFYEVARYGDRTLSVYRRMLAQRTGAACETGLVPPPEQAVATEIGEWCEVFERAHIILRLAPLLRERYND